MTLKLKHLVEDIDRHRNVRRYVRVPGRRKVRIRELPGTPEFHAAYERAIVASDEKPRGTREIPRGSFRARCVSYFASSAFVQLDQSAKNWRRHHLDEIARVHGGKPVALLQPTHIRKLRDQLQAKPVVANTRLKALRALFAWAVENEQCCHNPTVGMKPVKHISNGFYSWEL